MAPPSASNPLRGSAPKESQIGHSDLQAAEELTSAFKKMKDQLARVIVGQDAVVKQVLIALFCQGHCVLEGVPGLAKTLMIANISRLMSLSFRRIQFTPD